MIRQRGLLFFHYSRALKLIYRSTRPIVEFLSINASQPLDNQPF